MKMYAVKNDQGKFYDFDSNGDFWKEALCRKLYTLSENEAQDVAHDYGGHVVELVEAPAKVMVSEAEAEVLEGAKKQHNPAWYISINVDGRPGTEDRLMRAYVNGWTVEKPKRWNVKVPHVDAQEGLWFFVNSDGKVDATYDKDLAKQFTLAEIEHYGLQDCEKEEVTDDDAKK